jgi:3-deoxy-D-manno-octulosonic-acid transferase
MSDETDSTRKSEAARDARPRTLMRGLAAGAIYGYVRLVRATARVIAEPTDPDRYLKDQHPAINVFWHGQTMMIPAYRSQAIPYSSIVARHGDAEIVAGVLERFGITLIRGAGSGGRARDRGGLHALREAARALAAGSSVSFTADVPPGEPRKVSPGVIMLARLSGCPVVPLAIASSRYIALDTWSRMTINLPFSRIGISIGEPVHVPRGADEAEQEHLRLELEGRLDAATKRAYELAGADPARATPRQRLPAELAAGAAPPPKLSLKAYRGLTRALRPIAPMILRRRAAKGKEDPTRTGERLGEASVPRPAGRLAWVHAASVGETNSVLPLIEAIENARPDVSILLTTGTVTSAAIAKARLSPRHVHQYVPLDAPDLVSRFLDHWRPDLALFVESEIWPNLVLETATRSVPMALVNARMSKRSFRSWRRRPGMSKPLFGRFRLVLAQSEPLARRFAQLGAPSAFSVGNLKLDAPPPPVDSAALEALRSRVCQRPLWLAASTHEGEDEAIAEAHAALSRELAGLLTIIVPRHPERGGSIEEKLSARGHKPTRRSTGGMPEAHHDIYVADTLGELGTLYSLSPFAFIGGSLAPIGGQNPIEAVKLGSAVITGPHWFNFKETYKELIRRKGALEVHSPEELADAVRRLHGDSRLLAEMRTQANAALATMTGALDRTLAAVLPLLPPKEV